METIQSDDYPTQAYLGINWLKYSGSQEECLKNKLSSQIIVHCFTKRFGRMWACIDPNKLIDIIQKNHGIYEVITDFPHKVYFDIDLSDSSIDTELFLESIKNIIIHFFPNADMAISGSVTSVKTSYHIVLQNYIVKSKLDQTTLKTIVKVMNELNSAFDWKVYTSNRQMKCINQSKPDGRVQELITNTNITAHCITCFINEGEYPDIVLPVNNTTSEIIQLSKARELFVISNLPKLKLKYKFDKPYLDLTPIDVLRLLPITATHDHAYTHRIARFCFYNGLTLDNLLQWIKHKHDERGNDFNEVVDKWTIHWSRLDRFPEVTMSSIKHILDWYYPQIKKDMFFTRFESTFNIDEFPTIRIDRLSQSEFFNAEKYKIFNIGMGGGKTAQTVDYLSTSGNFVWIAPNRALAYNTYNRLQESHLNVTYYSTIPTKDKQNGALNRCDNLLIVANSLHYVTTRRFNDVVIDEIETLIDKWFGTFMKFKKQNWEVFKRILLQSRNVILLDAFITTKTLNLIKSIDPTGSLCIYARYNEPVTRTIIYKSSYLLMMKHIMDDLKNGLKLFIFYPYKNDSNFTVEDVHISSMESIYKMIEEQTGKKGIYYNADIDEPIKKGLRNVNVSWLDKSFVITNAVITCGVNYDDTTMSFDKEYLFVSSFTVPRDIIQVSYRPRILTTNKIIVGFMGKMTQEGAWESDTLEINCPIYTQMIETILIEKKSPIRKSIELFAEKAHYIQISDSIKITEDLRVEISELLAEYDVPYKHVPDVDFSYKEPLQELIFKGQATMMEKLMLQKYFFTSKFYSDTPKDELDDLWRLRMVPFTYQYIKHLHNENSVFKKIEKLNKLNNIFSLNPIKKIVINEEIREQIFTEFKFKNLHKRSATISILPKIYNTFFKHEVIKKIFGKNNNVSYTTDIYVEVTSNFIDKYGINIPIDD